MRLSQVKSVVRTVFTCIRDVGETVRLGMDRRIAMVAK